LSLSIAPRSGKVRGPAHDKDWRPTEDASRRPKWPPPAKCALPLLQRRHLAACGGFALV
jgi:hypothetical protein